MCREPCGAVNSLVLPHEVQCQIFLLYAPALYEAVSFSDPKQSCRQVFWADPRGAIKVCHLWYSMPLNFRHAVISAPTVKVSSITADCRNTSFWINFLICLNGSFLIGKGGRNGGMGKRMVFLFYHQGDLWTFSKQHLWIWFIAFMLAF